MMKKVLLGLLSTLFLSFILAAQPAAAQRGSAPLFGEDRDILVSPQTFLLDDSKSAGVVAVTVHADIPFSLVEGGTVELTVGSGSIFPSYTFADDRGDLVAKFDWERVEGLFEGEEGETEVFTLTLTCDLIGGGTFKGDDDVRVVF